MLCPILRPRYQGDIWNQEGFPSTLGFRFDPQPSFPARVVAEGGQNDRGKRYLMSGTTLIADLPMGAWPAISIYLPTERTAPPAQAGATRLRNALRTAQERLRSRNFPPDQIDRLLRPALALLDDVDFWQHQEDGLAIFIEPDLFRPIRLGFKVPELTVVGPLFHIRPLLSLATARRSFILALSARRFVLYDCMGDHCSPVPLAVTLEGGVRAIGKETEFERTRRYSAPARSGPTGRAFVPVSHGLESPAEIRKAELIEYLRRIDSAVSAHLRASRAPLVLACEPEILGHYRGVNSSAMLIGEALHLNPFALDLAELRRRAYALLDAQAKKDSVEVKDQILARFANGDSRATSQLPEILPAAENGRIADLLVAAEAQAWGHFSPESGAVRVHGAPRPEDEDLLNRAAATTLRKGGQVHVLPMAEMPRSSPAAAALRY
jgi:Bacterial archaeo-eukaryotic release factor family 3